MTRTRREFAVATLGVALAGCVGSGGSGSGDGGSDEIPDEGNGESSVPTSSTALHVPYDTKTLRENVESGGVPKDGIPSVDEPEFAGPDDVEMAGGEPVFGLVRNGVARAYPQRILVHHEIVNDVIGGENVAVTYCPLTGTVQGFERGDVEFGVSGDLLNSNLVMYDRETDSRWPQMLATAISGPLTGETLRELRLVWTTWNDWHAAHPDTDVMTEETGHARRYGNDPYGGYNQKSGYYASDRTMFPPLNEDDREAPKTVVMGARTSDGAISFQKNVLLVEEVLSGSIDGTEYVAVAEPTFETAYVYANPDEKSVTAVEDGYTVDGERHAAAELPLDRVLAYDSMWFAWAGYYPDTTHVE